MSAGKECRPNLLTMGRSVGFFSDFIEKCRLQPVAGPALMSAGRGGQKGPSPIVATAP